jgi:hypothetical protein
VASSGVDRGGEPARCVRLCAHLRVEHVQFASQTTYLRHTSVDFTIPFRETPLADANGDPLFCIPLTLLQKRRLRRFSLFDEDNRAHPLLTQDQNGAVATGALVAAARQAIPHPDMDDQGSAAPDVPSDIENPPQAVYEDLWKIVHGRRHAARKSWRALACVRDPGDEREVAWREALVANAPFLTLAADLAGSFLVLTILHGGFLERRVLKYEYERPGSRPSWEGTVYLRAKQQQLGESVQRRRDEGEAVRVIRSGEHTIVRVKASTRVLDPNTGELSLVSRPEGGLELIFLSGNTKVHARTAADGTAAFLAPLGLGRLEAVPPAGLLEEHRLDPVVLTAGGDASIELCFREVDAIHEAPEESRVEPISLTDLVLRSIGWRSKPVVIDVPAVGQAESFHQEITSPDGLVITRCKLTVSSLPGGSGGSGVKRKDLERGPLQRSHVHLGRLPQESHGQTVVHLRPRPSIIVRAGSVSSLATAVMLWVLANQETHLVGILEPVATLLLLVPGALSAYIIRPQDPLTSSMVFGLRMLTIATGFISLIAAAIVIFSHNWSVGGEGQVVVGAEWSQADRLLWWCFRLSAATAAIMLLTWWWTVRMPERGRG